MQKKTWKKWLCGVIGVLIVWCGTLTEMQVYAGTTSVQTTKTETTAVESPSKTGQIVGVLAIFTVTCGITAYLVMRPSLKKLREAKENVSSADRKPKK